LQDLEVSNRIILKLIIKKQGARMWTGFIWLRRGQDSNKALVSVKGW
jgi:hypothetical protein